MVIADEEEGASCLDTTKGAAVSADTDISSQADCSGGGVHYNPGNNGQPGATIQNTYSAGLYYDDANGDSNACTNISDDYVYFRTRLAGTPHEHQAKKGLSNNYWWVLIDIDGDSLTDFYIRMDGNGNRTGEELDVIYESNGDNDPTGETIVGRHTNPLDNGYVQAVATPDNGTVGDSTQYFLDFQLPVTDFDDNLGTQMLCYGASVILSRHSTSSNNNNPYQKDYILADGLFPDPMIYKEPTYAISKAATDVNGAPLNTGDMVEYTITVNNASSTLSDIVVTDDFPAGATFNANAYGVGSGIQVDIGGSTYNMTNVADSPDAGGCPASSHCEADYNVTTAGTMTFSNNWLHTLGSVAPAYDTLVIKFQVSYASAGTYNNQASSVSFEIPTPLNSNVASVTVQATVADSDSDGIVDPVEISIGSDPNNNDSDGDGVPDGLEAPSCIGVSSCTPVDTDGDGDDDLLDQDSDDDGLEDDGIDINGDGITETTQGSNHLLFDSDTDGLGDGIESGVVLIVNNQSGSCSLVVSCGGTSTFTPDSDPLTTTNPLNDDSDSDGVLDGTEDTNLNGQVDNTIGGTGTAGSGETDPLNKDTDGDGLEDGSVDLNADTLTEGGSSTSPLDTDTDDGGVDDGTELITDSTNPLVGADDLIDTDGDGIYDSVEITIGSDPNSSDSDGDGIADGAEAPSCVGASSCTPVDTDGDTTPNIQDTDDDGDGIPTSDEDQNNNGDPTDDDPDSDGEPNYLDLDSDDDGILDQDEVGDPNNPTDTDGDGTPDYHDDDSDGDGVPDSDEGTGDHDGDGIPNYQDYDPMGYFYDESDGTIITGGSITASGPGVVTIISDGSGGMYQWVTDGTPGTYTINVTLPSNYVWSSFCLKQDPPAFDPTGGPSPTYLGAGQVGATGILSSTACSNFYLAFDLGVGDPFILNNNLPLRYVDKGFGVSVSGGSSGGSSSSGGGKGMSSSGTTDAGGRVLGESTINQCLIYDEFRNIEFKDLNREMWYAPYFNILKNLKIANAINDQYIISGYDFFESGTGTSMLGPENYATRFEVVKTALISNCIPIYQTLALEGIEFKDLPRKAYPNDPEKDFVTRVMYTALDRGIISGYDGYVYANEIAKRAETLKILLNASDIYNEDEILLLQRRLYDDVYPSAWFYDYAQFAAYNGITAYTDEITNFYPSRWLTRAELAAFNTRILYQSSRVDSEIKDTINTMIYLMINSAVETIDSP